MHSTYLQLVVLYVSSFLHCLCIILSCQYTEILAFLCLYLLQPWLTFLAGWGVLSVEALSYSERVNCLKNIFSILEFEFLCVCLLSFYSGVFDHQLPQWRFLFARQGKTNVFMFVPNTLDWRKMRSKNG